MSHVERREQQGGHETNRASLPLPLAPPAGKEGKVHVLVNYLVGSIWFIWFLWLLVIASVKRYWRQGR